MCGGSGQQNSLGRGYGGGGYQPRYGPSSSGMDWGGNSYGRPGGMQGGQSMPGFARPQMYQPQQQPQNYLNGSGMRPEDLYQGYQGKTAQQPGGEVAFTGQVKPQNVMYGGAQGGEQTMPGFARPQMYQPQGGGFQMPGFARPQMYQPPQQPTAQPTPQPNPGMTADQWQQQNQTLLKPQTVQDPAFAAKAQQPPVMPPQPQGPMQPGQGGWHYGPDAMGNRDTPFGWQPSMFPGQNAYMVNMLQGGQAPWAGKVNWNDAINSIGQLSGTPYQGSPWSY